MNPNVLFIVYCLIAIPIHLTVKNLHGALYSIGELIGISLIPLICLGIYNYKKGNRTLRIVTGSVIILWILITVFGTLGKYTSR